jgi:hypothetical protein
MGRFAAGKRTIKRRAMNLRLKKMFLEKGYQQTCELKLEGCLRTFALSWAHSRKSRFLTDDEKWMHACLSCCSCHDKAEAMSHDEMFKLVSGAIEKRDL